MKNFGISRPLITQQGIFFGLTVPGSGQAAPISGSLGVNKLITSFIISNPLAGSSVYLGSSPGTTNVAGPNQGLEIQAGTAPNFRISAVRQLYEIQALNAAIAKLINCQDPNLEKIPEVVWDLTQLFLFSANAAGSPVTVAAFPEAYL